MNETTATELIHNLPAIITAVGVIVTAYLSYRSNQQSKQNTVKLDEVREQVDGKMEKLIEVTKAAAKTEGILQERDSQPTPAVLISPDDVVKVEIINLAETKKG